MINNSLQVISCTDMIALIHEAAVQGNINYAHELIVLFETEKTFTVPPKDEMRFTLLKGIVMMKRGDYKKAEEGLLRSLELAITFGDTRLICNRYDNLVTLYTLTNQMHLAIDYLKKSMELKGSAGDDISYARSLLQLSSMLFSIEDFEDGKDALMRADAIIAKLDDKELQMYCQFANANLLVRENKYDEALEKFQQVIVTAQEINDVMHLSRAYHNQGDILIKQEKWIEAEVIYLKLLAIARHNHLMPQELLASIQLAWIALRNNKLKRCRELYNYVNYHKDLGEEDALRENLAELAASLFEAEGDHQGALKAYKEYMKDYKTHYDNEQSKVVLFVKARYESEKRERELQEVKVRQMESEIKALTAEQELRKSENKFNAWIENGTEMIIILNQDLIPTYTSPYIFKTLGYTKEEFGNLSAYELIQPDDLTAVTEALMLLRQTPGLSISAMFRFPQKDGKYRWIEGTATNLLLDESVKGIVCNLKDITERKQAEEDIQELNKSLEIKIKDRTAELQEAVNDLESFSYSVSHDLRSPLRIITGYAKLLIADHGHQFDEEATEFINTILQSSTNMGQLIDDLLNFSRMGRKALYKHHTDIENMVKNIITNYRKADSGITKNIVIHELPPAFCDMALIKQVWTNLISNAIKYSGKKQNPVIHIGSITGHNEIIYYIKDNGAGFDMKFAKNLFTVFKRLHDKSDFEGMGVGLALAQRIIKMHEGRIWAEAEVEKGATFYFALPEEPETV